MSTPLAGISEPVPEAHIPTSSPGHTDLAQGGRDNHPPDPIPRKRPAEVANPNTPLWKRTRISIPAPPTTQVVTSNSQDLPSSPPMDTTIKVSGNILDRSPSVVGSTTDSGSMTEAYTQAEHDHAQRRADLKRFRQKHLESAIIEASESLKEKHYEWMKTPIITLIRPLLDYVTAHEDRFDSQVHGIDARMRIMGDDIKVMRSDINIVGERITGLEDRITGLEDRVTGLEDRISGLEDRVTGLEDRVTELGSEVKQFRLEVNDRFKQVDEKLDSVLSMMKEHLNRSIYHD